MDSEQQRKAEVLALAGVVSGLSRDEIKSHLLASGVTGDDANEVLARIMAAHDSVEPNLRLKASDCLEIHDSLAQNTGTSLLDSPKFFEVPAPADSRLLCSDNMCPCSGDQRLEPGKSGFLYISKHVVSMRADARSWEDFLRKVHGLAMTTNASTVIVDNPILQLTRGGEPPEVQVLAAQPLFLCEHGAKNRGLNLEVAAADAKHW